VSLNGEDDRVVDVGKLIFQGGLRLKSSNQRFGGVSGLATSSDGRRLSAVTDRGEWLQFKPVLSPAGKLIDVSDVQIGRLRGPTGKLLRRKRDKDAESLATIGDGFAVAFEHNHRIWLYQGRAPPFLARPTKMALPKLPRAMPRNAGLEALARLRDGRLVAIAEDFPSEAPYLQGWEYNNNQWRGFQYHRHALFLPAGATTLPSGDLLVLERRFTLTGGFATRLVTIPPSLIGPNTDVTGLELARLERPVITENFEGVASYRNSAGETILYLISDGNFFVLQRTLLLKFVLKR
jgi:hypothetical protein